MIILDTIFGFYDNAIAKLPSEARIFVAFFILFLIVMSFISIIKKGHWIFILLFAILFPGGWPALKIVGNGIVLVIKFLLTRIGFSLE